MYPLANMGALWGVGGALLGAVIAAAVFFLMNKARRTNTLAESQQILEAAEQEAQKAVSRAEVDAKAEFIKLRERLAEETTEARNELKGLDRRLTKREDNLERKLDTLSHKERGLENGQKDLERKAAEISSRDQESARILAQHRAQLQKIAGMGPEDAKKMLLERMESEVRREAGGLIERIVGQAREEANAKARDIIVTAIQRTAAEHTSESTVSAVDIPSDDMKGRVIGREGRNIRAFEKATGVDVIVDDTPGVVVVSGFDPVRREVARRALTKLITDGRIHPARIEEIVAATREELDNDLVEIGKKTTMDLDIRGLHGKLGILLGRLHFRTSYGQNVLRHSIEVAVLCEMMANELGLDGQLARRCGLLHDIGKAVDQEMEGGHPQIGHDICKRHNEAPEVLNACFAHHGDADVTSIYTPLVSAGDAISASRPGARRESLERYIKRLEALEGIATGIEGVKQAYAIQAGREVRVLVDANSVDDKTSWKVARDIANAIEAEMTYPGEIRVTVLREVRAVEYAR